MADRTVADIIADECIHDDADLATLQAMLDENERLRAELRRFRRIIIDAEVGADCDDLCGVLCAGPCHALDEIAAISQAAGLDELTGEPPIRRPYPLVGPHQGGPMTEHSEDFVMVGKSVVGGLTANVKRWRGRASAERLKRQRWRKRALAAEAEVKRLRDLVGQHDPTGADHLAEMMEHAQRADALQGENERLREALRAAGLAPSVVAAIARGEPPRPCPAGHGTQCCGYPAACEASLSQESR